jgi:signal transduction histidine kinase
MATLHLPEQLDLNRFLSVQAHDLKTPFNHIIGFSRVMLSGQDGPLTEYQREDLTTIYNSGARMLDWLSAIIEIARLNGGEKTPQPSEFDLPRVMEEALSQWKRAHPTRKFDFENRCTCAKTTCHLDEFQIRQALVSFVSYVAEFVKPPARILLIAADEDDHLFFTIRSLGEKNKNPSAIDLELQGYIGQAYITQHGGKIRLVQENEDGVTIQFTLPRSVSSA